MLNSKFGRFLRRIVGEETGAVLMEYVILAVMIAAACVVAVIYFGRTTNKQLESAINATGGNTEAAAAAAECAQKEANTGTEKAENHIKRFSDIKGDQK